MNEPSGSPHDGRIERVSGRATRGAKRSGLPKVNEITLRNHDGTRVNAFTARPSGGEGTRTATVIRVIRRGTFPYCPICLDAEKPADTLEHVPPKAFGGTVMANTCAECNNQLGSRTESALQDWYDNAIQAYFTSDGSPAPFGHDRVFVLEADRGGVVLMPEHASVTGHDRFARLREANVELHTRLPRPAEYRTALLKSAYLAACLNFGGFAHTPSLEAARLELLQARDAASRRDVELGPISAQLTVYRTGRQASGPLLALLLSEAGEESVYLISLAGTLLVEWPFPDLHPMITAR